MITISCNNINDLGQETYDKIISQIDFVTLQCPSCSGAACLIKHARYRRTVRLPNSTSSILILRVKCKRCNATHALMLVKIVPYSQIPLDNQIDMINCQDHKTYLNDNPYYDFSDIRHIKSQFKQYWKQLIDSCFYGSGFQISIFCLNIYHMQFMQIRDAINSIYFISPT